jgi:acetylornithine deacetylase/succinyl-diaminopimelate desuccinylase-like protein|nr:M20/M25/M40 family metallo-hydrolase [Kofleriaceae bacterium]
MKRALAIAAVSFATLLPAAAAPPQPPAEEQKLERDIYKELVETNTSQSVGDTAAAAKEMAARLIAAGIPKADVQVFEPAAKRGDLVARLRGTGKRKPILLMAHIDVVEAKREDWTTDPYKLVEKDGYFYGRGTSDDKYMASAWVSMLSRMAREHYKPDRDLILVLETDEEISDSHTYGIQWLIKNHKDLLQAEFAINEGAEVAMHDGKVLWNGIQTTEKLFQSYWLEVKNPGGHSSLPRKDNAIYELADALARLEQLQFPVELNATTRAYFEKLATIEHGQLASDMASVVSAKPDPKAIERLSALPPYNAQLRTTCTPTRLEGGHADNALPQVARAMVNCRILPGHSPDEVQKQLEKALADAKIVVTPAGKDVTSAPAQVDPEFLAAVTAVSAKFWPGVPALPSMSTGATDGRFLRNIGIPCYGHGGLAADIDDFRAHGKDERVPVQSFFDGQEYLYELVKQLSS